MPWQNGGGVTTEIMRFPSDAAPEAFGWRISIAEIARSGPFSIFPDTDRLIAVIAGAGMRLRFAAGAAVALSPFKPFRFDGALPCAAELTDGPVRDLNVMVRRGEWQADLDIVSTEAAETALTFGDCDVLAVLALAGSWTVGVRSGQVAALGAGEALSAGRDELPAALTANGSGGGRAAVIRLRRP